MEQIHNSGQEILSENSDESLSDEVNDAVSTKIY